MRHTDARAVGRRHITPRARSAALLGPEVAHGRGRAGAGTRGDWAARTVQSAMALALRSFFAAVARGSGREIARVDDDDVEAGFGPAEVGVEYTLRQGRSDDSVAEREEELSEGDTSTHSPAVDGVSVAAARAAAAEEHALMWGGSPRPPRRRSSTTECMICLEPLAVQAPALWHRLPQRRFCSQLRMVVTMACCGRQFHQGCIETWLRGSATCPNCRSKEPAATVVLYELEETASSVSAAAVEAGGVAIEATVPWKPPGWDIEGIKLQSGGHIDQRKAACQLRWLTRPGSSYVRKVRTIPGATLTARWPVCRSDRADVACGRRRRRLAPRSIVSSAPRDVRSGALMQSTPSWASSQY